MWIQDNTEKFWDYEKKSIRPKVDSFFYESRKRIVTKCPIWPVIIGISSAIIPQPIMAAPDSEIGISKRVSQAPVVLTNGNISFEYTINVSNPNTFDIENIQVEDDLTAVFVSPANIVSASVTSSDFSIDHSGIADTTLLDGTDNLAAGASGTITIAVEADFAGESGPYFNSANFSGDTICEVGVGTTAGARVRLWNTGSQNAPTRFASLALEFNGGLDAGGFRVRNGNPTINRLTTNFANVFRGVRDRNREEAGRADGWVSAPCLREGQTWEIRAATGTAFGTYLAAFRSDAAPTSADIVTGFTTNFTIGPDGTSPIDGEGVGNRIDSAEFTATAGLPVGLVLQMDDRGSNNGFAVQERIDGGAWTTIPAGRIWEDKPGPSPVIRTLNDTSDNGINPAPTSNNGEGGVDDPTPVSNPSADLVTIKTLSSGDNTPDEGDTVIFAITVRNDGPANATGVALTDLIPAGLTATVNNGSTDDGAGNAVGTYDNVSGLWNIGTLANGASATLTLEGTVDDADAGTSIQNVTTPAIGDQPDPDDSANDLEETVTVASRPDLSILKEADDDELVTVGQVITYRYTVTNTGNEVIRNIEINDTHNAAGPAPTPADETLLTDNGTQDDSTDATSDDGTWDVLAPGDVIRFTGTYTVQQDDILNLQ